MDVCVITGGGSGMGLAAAKYVDKSRGIVLAGRAQARLERALKELGFAIAMAADERNGFLTGTDILCDGGATLGRKLFRYKL